MNKIDTYLKVGGNVIAYAGPTADAPPPHDDEQVYAVPAVLPGLWDAHSHFMGMPFTNLEVIGRTEPATAAARATDHRIPCQVRVRRRRERHDRTTVESRVREIEDVELRRMAESDDPLLRPVDRRHAVRVGLLLACKLIRWCLHHIEDGMAEKVLRNV